MASVPFGCRYRLVDFALSNMVNSNISNISIITHYNYQSLMDHIGSGKDWDLARRSGGIKILPPYITAFANNINQLYRTRLEALKSVNSSISKIQDDYVVLSDCDVICNIDLNDMIRNHIENNADITMAVKKVNLDKHRAKLNVLIDSDENGKITDVQAQKNIPCIQIRRIFCLYIFIRRLLQMQHGTYKQRKSTFTTFRC
jgi:glucose-1-phosphate adenylyltransferase